MKIKEKIVDDIAVLSLRGNLMGGSETNELREKIYSLVSDDIKKVVIDFSKVKWLNSKGIGALISCHTTLVNNKGKMKLANVTEKVQSLFMITQLIKIFETYETADRAIASFR